MPNTGENCSTTGQFRCTSCGETAEWQEGAQFGQCPTENKDVEWEEAGVGAAQGRAGAETDI